MNSLVEYEWRRWGFIMVVSMMMVLSNFNAKRSQVMGTRISEKLPRPKHPLDSSNAGVLSVASYFHSLQLSKPLTLRGLLVSIVGKKFKNNMVLRELFLILVGCIPFIGSIRIAERGLDILHLVDRGLELLPLNYVFTLSDFYGNYRRLFGKKDGDALDVQMKAEYCGRDVIFDPVSKFPELLDGETDEIVWDVPEPVLPDLLPGFCVGTGGLAPLQSPRKAKRNLIMSEMLNRLAANLLVDGGVEPESKRFQVLFGGQTIRSVEDLLVLVPGISVFFDAHASTFGINFCVKEADNQYVPIPWAWRSVSALRNPKTGQQLVLFAYHSSLVAIGNKDTCPLGEFRVQFFLDPKGLTAWNVANEFDKPYAPFHTGPMLSREEIRKVALASSALACSMNLSARTMNLFKGGYGYHGTCIDTTSVLKMILYQRIDDFPLGGDGKSLVLPECLLLGRKLQGRNDKASLMFQEICKVIYHLPDDLTILPHQQLTAIKRVNLQVHEQFDYYHELKRELIAIQQGWEEVVKQIL